MPQRTTDPETGETGFIHLINGQPRFIADDPANAPGADVFLPGPTTQGPLFGGSAGAAVLGFGETLLNTPLRAQAAIDTLQQIGEEDAEKTEAQIEFDDVQRLLAPLEKEHPFATGLGQSVPGFALPASRAVNTLGGIAEGMLAVPDNPILGGILSGGGALVGGELGQRLGTKIAARSSSAAGRLAARNIPTTLFQRTGSPPEKSIEAGLQSIPVVSAWASAPIRAQQRALNRGAASVFGFEGKLTPKGLGEIKQGIQKSFQEVQSAIPDQQLPSQLVERLEDAGVVDQATKDFMQGFGIADGEALMSIRSNLNSDMADAFINANRKEGRQLRSLLAEVDEVIGSNMPDGLKQQWKTARQQWQFLTALRKGKAISGDGTVNLASMNNALNAIYPNFRVGKDLPGSAQGFGELVQALDELPKALQTSGTAERAAAGQLLTGAADIALSPLAILPGARAAGRPGTTAGAQLAVSAANPVAEAVDEILKDLDTDDEL